MDLKIDEIKETFAERLKAARKMRGLTMDSLSELTDGVVSKSNLSKYENGKMMPSAATHIALSKALQLDFDYFFRPFTVELTKIEFRKQKKLKKHEEGQIVETVKDIAERYTELETLITRSTTFANPASDIEVKTTDDVVKVAERVREAWGLGNGVLLNVVNMLEEHGLKVVELDAPDAFDGMHATINGNETMIVLNSHYTVERKRFNALHELGHEILHFAPLINEDNAEKLCHYFASEMLLPSYILKGIVRKGTPATNASYLRSIQTQYGISIDAIWHKLKDVGRVSESEYKRFFIVRNTKPGLKDYIMKSTYRGDEHAYGLERTIMEAVGKEVITQTKADEIYKILNINKIKDDNGNKYN